MQPPHTLCAPCTTHTWPTSHAPPPSPFPPRSGSPLDDSCDASAHKLSAAAPHYLLIDTNVALHQVGGLPGPGLGGAGGGGGVGGGAMRPLPLRSGSATVLASPLHAPSLCCLCRPAWRRRQRAAHGSYAWLHSDGVERDTSR